MNGKELIFKAFRLEETQRIPWVPFVGVHAGTLIDKDAEQLLKSEELLTQGINESIRRYQPDGIPVTFDLQIEAEALGCKLEWSKDNPPAVVSHPLGEDKKLEDLSIPELNQGRIELVMNVAKRIRKENPDIALYGLITGPFTLALHLLGTDIFMKMFMEEEYIKKLLDFARDVCFRMIDYYTDAGCDIIAVVDPMTSQIGPDQFAQFVKQPASEVFDYIRDKGKLGSFFVCGHAQQNIEVMCESKPDNISIDENIPLDFVKDICLRNNISFGGNMKLTMVLLMGDEQDCQKHALETMEIGGNKGFILAPGCDLPKATPPDNIAAITKLVNDPYQQDVIKALDKKEETTKKLNLSDYGKSEKVIVDIITIDSESCAPCQYMVEAVKKVVPLFEGIVEWREHSIKSNEAITFMSSLMVKNIPTICIDGKISFVSRIPPKEELIRAIQQRINEKLRHKIKIKKGEIFILGNEKECKAAEEKINKAADELGASIKITHLTTENDKATYGITSTPAVILAEYKLKTEGDIPPVPAIKEWIKTII